MRLLPVKEYDIMIYVEQLPSFWHHVLEKRISDREENRRGNSGGLSSANHGDIQAALAYAAEVIHRDILVSLPA
jgi:hypothetical protein